MADQGQCPPITSAPKRSTDHPQTSVGMPAPLHHLHGSESCKNSPNVPRRHADPAHHLPHHAAGLLLLESGSQSAKSSPLPNRRLDKLQGVIRDQRSTPIAGRRATEDCEMEAFDSPLVSRRFLQQQQPCECVRGAAAPPAKRRAASECACGTGAESQVMRKRVDSDCGSASSSSCLRKNVVRHNFGLASGGGLSSCENSPLPVRRQFGAAGGGGPAFPVSPAKSVLGEPGVFSSPIHRPYHHAVAAGFHGPAGGSPAKSVLGEPGVFSSPARSVVCSPPGNGEPRSVGGGVGEGIEDMDIGVGGSGAGDVLAGDQTIVSGWLKFRDNKKVSEMLG
uniref:Uncharacterized protein n=1 Tax=Anopheles epiroticus TaxID=199890 RepID=A0A182PLC0_9DIPT